MASYTNRGGGGGGGGGGGKATKEEKKARRRNAQAAKMEAKAGEEAKYFWDCVGRGGAAPPSVGEAELFGSQSTGINFAQYDAIPVTRGRVAEASVQWCRVFKDI